jgi:hypothetical protein
VDFVIGGGSYSYFKRMKSDDIFRYLKKSICKGSFNRSERAISSFFLQNKKINFLHGPHKTASGPSMLTWKVTRSYDGPRPEKHPRMPAGSLYFDLPCLSVLLCGLHLTPELQALLAPHSPR